MSNHFWNNEVILVHLQSYLAAASLSAKNELWTAHLQTPFEKLCNVVVQKCHPHLSKFEQEEESIVLLEYLLLRVIPKYESNVLSKRLIRPLFSYCYIAAQRALLKKLLVQEKLEQGIIFASALISEENYNPFDRLGHRDSDSPDFELLQREFHDEFVKQLKELRVKHVKLCKNGAVSKHCIKTVILFDYLIELAESNSFDLPRRRLAPMLVERSGLSKTGVYKLLDRISTDLKPFFNHYHN